MNQTIARGKPSWIQHARAHAEQGGGQAAAHGAQQAQAFEVGRDVHAAAVSMAASSAWDSCSTRPSQFSSPISPAASMPPSWLTNR